MLRIFSSVSADETRKRIARLMSVVCVACVALASGGSSSFAEEPVSIRIAAWNMEGNGEASTNLLKSQLADKEGIDLWGLCEVQKTRFNAFLSGAAEGETGDFRIIKGTTGGPNVRLAIIYNSDVLELVGEPKELHFVAVTSSLRAPLVAQFKGKQSGQMFWFMVNHLKCCGDGLATRKQQCKLISDWAEAQAPIPVLMCGDLNIPFDISTSSAGDDFAALVESGPFTWLQPEHLTKTQANPNFNSILDYFMVANATPLVERWNYRARILEREGDDPVEAGEPNNFDDDDSTTDHRPIDVTFTMNVVTPLAPEGLAVETAPASSAVDGARAEPLVDEILERIQALEAELQQLRARLEDLR
ncbi:MAG: hypothetical protein K1X74_05345 [Pirellulales bacterium]|nr:hypothetical protein [Pirellulales bacterium]